MIRQLLKIATILALLCLSCLAVFDSIAQMWSTAINIPDVTETSLNPNNYTMAIDTLGNIYLAWESFSRDNRGIFYSLWGNSVVLENNSECQDTKAGFINSATL